MKLTKTLILIAGLGLATSTAFADHRGHDQYDSRYQHHGKSHKHDHHKYDKKYYKYNRGDRYSSHYNSHYRGHHDNHYYVYHEHNRYCGHRYGPAFNTRVKVFLGI